MDAQTKKFFSDFFTFWRDIIVRRVLVTIFVIPIILVIGGVSSNWDNIMYTIDSIPATKIFFLVLTVALVVFAIPLYKRLTAKP